MLKLSQTIIVEGNYDKIRLSAVVDANILTTDGFRIFKDKKMMHLIGEYAKGYGIIILTDSDRAGFVIRSHIKGAISGGRIANAYVPGIRGKERRKPSPSKEGLLGVEGMSDEVILKALTDAAKTLDNGQKNNSGKKILTADLFEDGLCGAPNSAALRRALCKKLGYPTRLSQKALLDALNSLHGYDAYKKLLSDIKKEVD